MLEIIDGKKTKLKGKREKRKSETITPTDEEKAIAERLNEQKKSVTESKKTITRKERERIKDLFKTSLMNALQEKDPLTQRLYIDCITASAIEQAINGNIQAMTFIRDTIGEKPVERLASTDAEGNDLPIYDFSKLSTTDLMAIASKIGADRESKIIEADYEVLE